jgi:hypothetical protein
MLKNKLVYIFFSHNNLIIQTGNKRVTYGSALSKNLK